MTGSSVWSMRLVRASIDFDGTRVFAAEDDPVDIGLQVQSGHSGYHGVKYDIGAEREVCSNGMVAFVSELGFEQTHSDPFDPGLAYNAVDAVVESPEKVEQRLGLGCRSLWRRRTIKGNA